MSKSKLIVLPKDMWRTPDWLFKGINEEFHFRLDAAANSINTKCLFFISEEQNAFHTEWHGVASGNVWLNPPYGKLAGGLLAWNQRAYLQAQKYNMAVVCLVPGDTSTQYRKFAMKYGSEIRDLNSRVRFVGAPGSPEFPSALYIYRPIKYRKIGNAHVSIWDYKEPQIFDPILP